MRQIVGATLPAPCIRCGWTVTPEMTWHLGHIVDVALGGTDSPHNVGPEHKSCNERAGGRLGAKIAQQKRKERRSRGQTPKW